MKTAYLSNSIDPWRLLAWGSGIVAILLLAATARADVNCLDRTGVSNDFQAAPGVNQSSAGPSFTSSDDLLESKSVDE